MFISMFDEKAVKEAFSKVKTDIFSLGNEFYAIQIDILDIKNQINAINDAIDKLKIESLSNNFNKISPNLSTENPTHPQEKPSISNIPTHNPTVPHEIGGLKYPNFNTSTRNEGVPTDRQTNQQTDKIALIYPKTDEKIPSKPLKQQIQDAENLLDSLDSLKKEIRLKFKQITSQEMTIFSAIYELEEQYPEGVEYRQIAQKLGLSESSIRDYAQKLISKGIPLDKIKQNNKKILLRISSKLKNIASLATLIKLREL